MAFLESTLAGTRAGRISRVAAFATLWLMTTTGGMYALYHYAATPSSAADAPRQWPTQCPLRPAGDRWNLLIFAHPGCPCTRASLNELARIELSTRGRARITLALGTPDNVEDRCSATEYRQIAERIPGCTVLDDPGGSLAHAFGAHTSGQVLLYSATGELCFSGGITPSRGHEGPNLGRDAIQDWIQGRPDARRSTPVFGCELVDDPVSAPGPKPGNMGVARL